MEIQSIQSTINQTLYITIVTKNGQSGNTGRLNKNLYVMLKITERPKTPGITSKKTWLSQKGISCLQVIFVLIWLNQTLIWFNLQRDGTGNGLSNVSLHQSMRIFKAGLSSSYDLMAGENIKKKYLMFEIPIKMLKQHTIPNSSLHNLKI